MNARILLSTFKTRLQAVANAEPSGAPEDWVAPYYIGSALDHDFAEQLPVRSPAIWVASHRMQPINDGRGWTSLYQQSMEVIILVRAVVKRNAPGIVNAETGLVTAADAAADALLNWTPDGADEPLVWLGSTDGPYHSSLLIADLRFGTSLTYRKENNG